MPEKRTKKPSETGDTLHQRVHAPLLRERLSHQDFALFQLFFVVGAGERGKSPLVRRRPADEVASGLRGGGGAGSADSGAYYLDGIRVREAVRRTGRQPDSIDETDVVNICLEIQHLFDRAAPDLTGHKVFLSLDPLGLTDFGREAWYRIGAFLAALDRSAELLRQAGSLLGRAKELTVKAQQQAETAVTNIQVSTRIVYAFDVTHLAKLVTGDLVGAVPDPHPDDAGHARPHITQDELLGTASELAVLQAPVTERFQELLDRLKGRTVASPDESKWVARFINDLARRKGIELTVDSRPVDLRWHSRVFESRLLEAGKRTISSSAAFPAIKARAVSPSGE